MPAKLARENECFVLVNGFICKHKISSCFSASMSYLSHGVRDCIITSAVYIYSKVSTLQHMLELYSTHY